MEDDDWADSGVITDRAVDGVLTLGADTAGDGGGTLDGTDAVPVLVVGPLSPAAVVVGSPSDGWGRVSSPIASRHGLRPQVGDKQVLVGLVLGVVGSASGFAGGSVLALEPGAVKPLAGSRLA